MKVLHVKPESWIDTSETGVIQPSGVAGLVHEIVLEEGDLMQGPQGVPGVKGDTGEAGQQGVPGVKGDTGEAGQQGVPGVKGDTGEAGPQGVQGVKGDTGEAGPQGVPGVKGDTGAAGPQGVQGVKGDTGEAGPKGLPGVKGYTGAAGPQGVQGVKGDTGEAGPQGLPGVGGGALPDTRGVGAYALIRSESGLIGSGDNVGGRDLRFMEMGLAGNYMICYDGGVVPSYQRWRNMSPNIVVSTSSVYLMMRVL